MESMKSAGMRPASSAPIMAEEVRRLPATAKRCTRSFGRLFSAMKAGSAVWCRLPKKAPSAGRASSANSLRVLIIASPKIAPIPSPRMNEALRPMRSETSPAGTAVSARATYSITSRVPMNRMSKPIASR